MKVFRFLILIGIIMPMTISAQKNDSIANVQLLVQPAVNNTVVEALSATIQKLTDENKALQSELKQLKESKEKASQSGMAQSKLLADSLAQAKERLDKKSNELNKQKALSDSLAKVLKTMDALIYKRCLFYPLSIRYNQQRIDECMQVLKVYTQQVDEKHQSEELKECIKVYKPFLEGSPAPYLTYTYELVNLLDDISKKLAAVASDEKMLRDMKNLSVERVKNLKYYNFYLKRNVAPYRSIEFLDQALDHLQFLFNESRNVSGDIERLSKSLKPKEDSK